MSDDRFVTMEMKFLNDCEAGELVRANFRGTVPDWAIVARENKVVVVSGDKAPRRIYVTEKEKTLALSYGKRFELLPEYAGQFTVGGQFPDGSLICARSHGKGIMTDWHLVGSTDTSAAQCWYFNINQFSTISTPGPMRGGFANWAIWAWLPSQPSHMTKLYEHPVKPLSASRATRTFNK